MSIDCTFAKILAHEHYLGHFFFMNRPMNEDSH